MSILFISAEKSGFILVYDSNKDANDDASTPDCVPILSI